MIKNIALAGNPNSGKTTLFNALTGSKQYVGNWPGVTVEKKIGTARVGNKTVNIVDLPGIYSLATYSMEELVAREYLESDEPDLILNIVDATNIERNLFFTLQLIESGKPVVIALNMIDAVESSGGSIDTALMSELLGVPVYPVSASKNKGIDALLEAITNDKNPDISTVNFYSKNVLSAIESIETVLSIDKSPRLHAINYIEDGEKKLEGHEISKQTAGMLEDMVQKLTKSVGMDRDMIISDEKYKFITGVVDKCVTKNNMYHKTTMTEKIDRVVTNRILAIPIFLGVVLIMFSVAFGSFGSFIKGHFEFLINDVIIEGIANFLTSIHVSDWAYSLVVDGILGGVGSVLSFLPEIAILFLLLSILEDSGYMARAAFITDRMLRKFGLSGRSFIPMIIGFGCTVPALMATRTLENEKDRRLTMIITPFMSCGARLPVYALFTAAFFVQNQSLVIFSIYILGIVIAILSGLILKRFVTGDTVSGFLMELPEYRFPTLKNLWRHTWERIKGFIVKAGTILVAASIVIWFLQSFNLNLKMVSDSCESIFGNIGKLIAPVFIPLGFGEWKVAVSLLTGFVAKEAVVGTLSILYGAGEAAASGAVDITAALSQVFTPLSAYSFMTFTLLYMPCVAAFATMRREMNSWKWTLIAVCYQTAVAWIVAFLVYQIGGLMVKGIITADMIIAALAVLIVVLSLIAYFKPSKRKKNKCASCGACCNSCDRK